MSADTANSADYQHLLYEVDSDHICWLTLNRPEKINAMNKRLLAELREGLLRADKDDDVRVIVIRGSGKGFCAGHDLVEDANDVFKSIYHYRTHFFEQFDEFTTPWRITKPVIASVHKVAIGKGFELSLFCDITIVTSDTKMGYNEFRYGIAGHCMFLPWVVNMKTAKNIMLTGGEVTAHQAKEIGLITEVVEPDELHEATKRKAKLMAAIPPDIQRVHKMYLNRVYEMQGLKSATDYYLELVAITGHQTVPEYAQLMDMIKEHGLRAALDKAQERYKDLD
ncbi:enoyl-CoA hydratase/isomerase family protein [Sinorhizobium americanum]|uniref:Enoyl-CoA hydratase n=1 Tax=Sinorhizobium americanum TaxID=194963 RepID=A0A4R2B1H3_9HYPH|nr:enoyl-CoA hydratase-related protein [Sinorhizobium americanum]TCN20378.1 enoyl-CoA hydratase [Sinorhizobium americanum]